MSPDPAPLAAWSPARRLAAWGVHLFTASGAVAGLLALVAIARGDAAVAFWWMTYTLIVDSADGTMARAVGVKQVLPWIDGARLDDCVDYFTYVLVPAFFMVQFGLFPPVLAIPVAGLVCIASGYGFAQTSAKTADHFFTGFPSYWNVVAFYLWALDWSPWTNAAITTLLAVGVFVPLRYIYPSRTTTLRALTIGLAIAWGIALIYAMTQLPAKNTPLIAASLAFPAYYVGLSMVLHFRKEA